ncbi:MAG: efflux RND transporter permease subunit, partial [gamma proteobacterium symbiont of Bathyaustriella thionipta]|nr:efflux RND transporter permease subunit [gamma proteobacterium symbiont of Bathyaustriella thionipta]
GQIAHAIEAELKRVSGTRDIYTIGAVDRVVHVLLDPQALAAYNIDIASLSNALSAANQTSDNLKVTTENKEILIQAGTFITTPDEISQLVVGVFEGKAIFLSDVAHINDSFDTPSQYVTISPGTSAEKAGIQLESRRPAVTIAIAKKPGHNAVDIADNIIKRLDQIKGTFITDDVEITITRNYGKTADEKSSKLIHKLIIETIAVVLLVVFALGWREGIIVGTAVAITLLVTLFASWAYGFTLNRVSLFALIFSIGILVDDAIVVVENIHRHMSLYNQKLVDLIPAAVDEVGGPTILATFTVIAALLPMAFVSGLMGPYMSPIPINASMGMLASLIIAFVFTPWLTNIMLANGQSDESGESHSKSPEDNHLMIFFSRLMSPFLQGRTGRRNRWLLLLGIFILIGFALMMVVNKQVVLKMLPFDNKSELQVVLDMPEGTSLEQTSRVLHEIGTFLDTVDEITDYEVYAGTASPISFNGLIRQYYLREGANVGDIQVNLIDKQLRTRKSHEIALQIRQPIQTIALTYAGNAKIVEVPPGPPVQAPIVAEVYGLDYKGQISEAKKIRQLFEATADIIDVDDSIEYPAARFTVSIDRQKAALLGVKQADIVAALASVLSGSDVTYLHDKHLKYPAPVRLEYSEADKSDLEQVLALRVRSQSGTLVPLLEMVQLHKGTREHSIYHKDLLPVVFVTADMGGMEDSPLYGLFNMSADMEEKNGLNQWFVNQPENPYEYSLKWDGEWQITYETFRDMGIAYGVGLLIIYLLVVVQFRSYLVPLIIMAPIPLTIIGIMPGHALMGAQFTATSMIGMIALAGIIVRNSILLVDFINQQLEEGMRLHEAVIQSSAVRSKPIILTGIAAMIGGFFIIDDPIFGGLAISLIFGLLVSTLLTLIVIPIVYYAAMEKKQAPA